MKQVININFHGQVVPIEVSAFELLKEYTASLNRFFANEEGKEEIINDIESRIGELFQERLKKGATCITDDDVNAIIRSMGRPEEFAGEEEKVADSLGGTTTSQSGSSSSSSTTATDPAGPKRLYRDENNKILGGVCSGLANYFGTDHIIMRIIFIILAFAGAGILAYIILWVAVPSTTANIIGGYRKKLYRDPDEKVIAGVCSGIANYFGISVLVPRLLFVLPFLSIVFRFGNWGFNDPGDFFNFSFSPGSFFVYVILWIVFPEATTTAEKLEMKGEKVDMNSIKNSVMEEMKGVQKRAEKFGEEAKAFAADRGPKMAAELKTAARRNGGSLGNFIVWVVKIFAYIILGSVALSLVVALFAFAIAATGVFPYKAYVLTDGLQNWMAWGTLIFFIAVPVIGVIAWIIRRFAKMKNNRRLLRTTFISLWIVGWVCFMTLLATVLKDFKSTSHIIEEEVALSNPLVSKLEVTTNAIDKKLHRFNDIRFEPFDSFDEDSAYIRNMEVKIVKADSDSFRVTVAKLANGRTRRYADTLARLIDYDVQQKDSMLVLGKGIQINTTDKFRNQRVIVTVYVPVGKQIKINDNIGWGSNVRIGGSNDFDIDIDEEEEGWDRGVTYIMKADGLYTLDGKPADESRHPKKVTIDEDGIDIEHGDKHIRIDENGVEMQSEGPGSYRYDQKAAPVNTDSIKLQNEQEQRRKADSLKKAATPVGQTADAATRQEAVVLSSYQAPMFMRFGNL